MNGEQNDAAHSMPILREWVDEDFPMRARGELSQKPTEEGWWQEGLVSNFMVHYAWMLHYGMDFTEQNHPYIDSEELWPAHRFFTSTTSTLNLQPGDSVTFVSSSTLFSGRKKS